MASHGTTLPRAVWLAGRLPPSLPGRLLGASYQARQQQWEEKRQEQQAEAAKAEPRPAMGWVGGGGGRLPFKAQTRERQRGKPSSLGCQQSLILLTEAQEQLPERVAATCRGEKGEWCGLLPAACAFNGRLRKSSGDAFRTDRNMPFIIARCFRANCC